MPPTDFPTTPLRMAPVPRASRFESLRVVTRGADFLTCRADKSVRFFSEMSAPRASSCSVARIRQRRCRTPSSDAERTFCAPGVAHDKPCSSQFFVISSWSDPRRFLQVKSALGCLVVGGAVHPALESEHLQRPTACPILYPRCVFAPLLQKADDQAGTAEKLLVIGHATAKKKTRLTAR